MVCISKGNFSHHRFGQSAVYGDWHCVRTVWPWGHSIYSCEKRLGSNIHQRLWVTRLSTHLVPVSGNVIQGLAWAPHLVNDPLYRDMKYNTWVWMRWGFNLPQTAGLQDRMLPARAVLGCVSALLLLRAYRVRQLWFVHIRDVAIFPPTHFFVFNYSWPVYYWYILTYCTFFP